jgi:hypothetical protein
MNEKSSSPTSAITRREALLRAVKGTVGAAAAAPVLTQASPPTPAAAPNLEFVPDNDYPFFGGTLPEGY